MILWAAVVVLAAVSQWFIIERLEKFPKKTYWFIARVIVAGIFLELFIRQGYVWYWAVCYLVFVFWLPFNVILNLLRGKGLIYLSPENSKIDKWVLKIFRIDVAVYGFGLIAMLAAIGVMIFYGHCTWAEANYGNCR